MHLDLVLDADDARPPYVQIASGIRRAIEEGVLPPGSQLPSGPELAAQLGVSRATVQHALASLKDDGIVVARQGQGVFVRSRPGERPPTLPELASRFVELEERLALLEAEVHGKRKSAPPRKRS